VITNLARLDVAPSSKGVTAIEFTQVSVRLAQTT
jgi:hypothetical protein